MTGYKLTTQDACSRHGGCRWGPGVTHKASGEGPLCAAGWIHFYSDPLLAALMDPIHGDYGAEAKLWLCEASGSLNIEQDKSGATVLMTVREVALPAVTVEQRVRFGILCALEVCDEPGWRSWADAWLSGRDRSEAAARAAAWSAWSAARAAQSAEWSAWSAAWSAQAAEAAARAAEAAARAAARSAEWSAAWSARAEWSASSSDVAAKVDLALLARRACEVDLL